MTRTQLASPMAWGLAAILSAATVAQAAPFSIVDGEGFESPAYDTAFLGTGQLEGQFASTNGGFGSVQWTQSPIGGTSTAVVQDSVVASGDQAVRVDRAAGSDDRWGVFQTGFPGERYVCIEWDMWVEQTTGATFGPFFGVEAYDDDATQIGLLGSLGVDATTGDVLFQQQDTGFFVETGEVVNFGEWNSFRIILDYTDEVYYTVLNESILLGVEGFVDENNIPGGLNQFTDADIAAIAAGNDPASVAATGTAYFDNFSVVETDDITGKIPEPTSLLLAATAAFGLVGRRRG